MSFDLPVTRIAGATATLISSVAVVGLSYGISLSGGDALHSGTAAAAAATNPNCSPNVVPTGQANPPGSESEPMAPIWCFTLNKQGSPTRVTGANDWVDTFQGVTQMGTFNDGDLGYRVFDGVQNGGTAHTQHFTNNNHWMDDNAGGFLGGTLIRPNRSFTFENGKLVVEADVAAGISGYSNGNGGDVAWPELDISTADSPNGHPTTDSLYAYGRFGGFDTFGCRLHSSGNPICAYEAARAGASGQDSYPCFEFAPARLIEISWFEGCGGTHTGGYHSGDQAQYFRQCSSVAQSPDMMCRDRFRMELAQDGLKLYVNGLLYMEDSGWPARNQLPASVTNGSTPVYVYMSDWQDTPSDPAYRFHWARFAVNPHTASGGSLAPSASPSFCLGMPNNTCAMTSGSPPPPAPTQPPAPSTPIPTPAPASTATPVPTTAPASASFTSTGSTSPNVVARGATVWLSGSVKSSAASTALIDLEVYDPTGTRVFQQSWDNQSFTAGATRMFNTSWVVPSAAATGSYTIAVGVFSPGWGTVYDWNGTAASFSVTTAATPTSTPVPPTQVPQSSVSYTSTAALSPSIVAKGSAETMTASVKSSAAGSALIDIEVYDSGGARVFQQTFGGQSFSAGQTRTFQAKWAVPSTALAGTYTVKVGVFSSGWGTLYNWNDRAGTFTVQ